MLTRLPGFVDYSSLAIVTVDNLSQMVIPPHHWANMLQEYLNLYPHTRPEFERVIKTYNFTDDIPKW